MPEPIERLDDARSAPLIGKPLMQVVLETLRQLPDRAAHEELLRRMDSLERSASRSDERLEPVINHEAVAAALDERLGKARDHAERRIEGRIASIERQLATICEQIHKNNGRGDAAEGDGAGQGGSAEQLEMIVQMLKGGRIAGIEKKVDRLNHAVQNFAPANVNEQIDSIRAELTDLRQSLAAGDTTDALQRVTTLLEATPGVEPLKDAIVALTHRVELNERAARAGMEQLITAQREQRQTHEEPRLVAAIERLTARLSALEAAQGEQAERFAAASERIEKVSLNSASGTPDGATGVEAPEGAVTEAIAALNGRLDRIERAMSVRDPLLAQIGGELRRLHGRLDGAEKRGLDEQGGGVATPKGSPLSVSASFSDQTTYSEPAGAQREDRSAVVASAPVEWDGYAGVEGRNRWRSAALLALTLAIIVVPMVMVWQEIGHQIEAQNRMVEELHPGGTVNEPGAAGASDAAGVSDEAVPSAAVTSAEASAG